MALNTSNEAIEAKRLEYVAALRLRGRTQREIQIALAREMTNPATGEPYSLGTINSDLKKLERQWRKSAEDSIVEHKARQLAEIGEVKRQAWLDRDQSIVLRALDLEATITGTKSAIRQEIRQEITGKDGGEIPIKVVDYRHGITALTARPDDDSDAPGEN